jgi:hypothetical protein
VCEGPTRAVGFSLILGVVSVCRVVGPFLSKCPLNWVLIILMASKFINLAYVFFFVSESLSIDRRQPWVVSDFSPWKVFRILGRTPLFLRLSIVVLLSYVTLSGQTDIGTSVYTIMILTLAKKNHEPGFDVIVCSISLRQGKIRSWCVSDGESANLPGHRGSCCPIHSAASATPADCHA